MATSSVSDFSIFINQQIKIQEQIEATLVKLDALITIAVTANNFYEVPKTILHSYLLAVGDLIDEVSKVNQGNLNILFNHVK